MSGNLGFCFGAQIDFVISDVELRQFLPLSINAMDSDKISHYRILEKLGAGGMGEVYLAEDMKLGRKVAIKILGDAFTTNRDRLNRFEQEACAASALNHPNILTIHEVGTDNERHFIATEFIDGQTLRRKMSQSHLEMQEILDIAVQVASALEEAHAAGIIHRDIKPDNIMIRRNGYVKVLDFGLAKLTETSMDRTPSDAEASTRVLVQTDAGVVMGTSHYMSPEQTRGKPVDARSDIWSLGVVMYEMVAGRTPFDGETSTDVIVAITQKEPPPVARFAPDVPAELDWIINKALRKDREERYQTIRELLTDLRRLKQRMEFEAELERSVSPDSFNRTVITASAIAPTISEKVVPTAEKTVTHVSSVEYIASEIKRHRLAAILAMIVLVVVGGGLLYYFKIRQPLSDKDTVLLADFVNTTGENVFDGTLKQALAVQLGQTPFLNIFPDERVRETLRFMGRSPDDRITRDVAKEICERQGIKALLTGSIASLGSHYVITLEAINGHTGDSIAREQVEADSKEKVLSALGAAASSLRQKLGESLSSIKKYDVAIEQATTSSLDALKAYTTGNELRARGKNLEASSQFKRAIELDPNFAMANARLAVFYGNSFQPDLAQQYAERAFALKDRVSEHEKFYISEKYYNYVTGEIDKSIEVLQEWAKEYPNDYIPHINLGVNYTYIGKYEDAVKETSEAIRLDPHIVTAHSNLAESFMRLNRFDEAQQVLNQAWQQNFEADEYHFLDYRLAFARRDEATKSKEFEWLSKNATPSEFLDLQGGIAQYYGQLSKAADFFRRSAEAMKQEGRPENASQEILAIPLLQAMVGSCQSVKPNITAALALTRGKYVLAQVAQIYAQCGDGTQVELYIQELQKRFPKDTATVSILIPTMRAMLENYKGNSAEAVDLLEPVRRFEPGPISGYWTIYLRGEVYRGLKSGQQAAAEFERIIENRGMEPLSIFYPLAYLGMARAQVLLGDTSKARQFYQDFFALWKDADHDLPVLTQAKKEYDQLK
ncbi:MAG: protein kinase [Pyrinomonadaceae bacterium]